MVAVPFAVRQLVAEQRAERALLEARFLGPVEPVVVAVAAHELLRVLQHAIGVAVDLGIVHLRIVVGTHRLHGGQLVAANAPQANLLAAGLGVEAPAVLALEQRQGEGQGRVADHQVRAIWCSSLDHMFLAVEGKEGVDILALDVVGRNIVLPVIAKQRGEAHGIALFGTQGADQRLDGSSRAGIGLLGVDVQGQQGQQCGQEYAEYGVHGEPPFSADGRHLWTMSEQGAEPAGCYSSRVAGWRRHGWLRRG
ncbi:hypothetical protein D3C84_514160 [compost metagenome]